MSTLQIALIGLVIVLLLAWLWLRQRDTRGRSGSGWTNWACAATARWSGVWRGRAAS